MKLYTIIAGVNGAGKSSLTGALKAERTDLGIIVDVDKIAAAGGLSPIAASRPLHCGVRQKHGRNKPPHGDTGRVKPNDGHETGAQTIVLYR